MRRFARWLAGRAAVIGVPYLWLAVFFLLPFLVVARISVSEMETTTIKDIVAWKDGAIAFSLNFGNYLLLLRDTLYFSTFVASLKYAAVTTLLCLAIGYPFAYFMARARRSLQPALLMLVMLPFWTSFLLRVYAWKALLTEHGLVAEAIEAIGLDRVLAAFGLVPGPGQLMNTPFSLVLGMTYTYLPFMILPLYSNLAKMDLRLLEAASDLGASRLWAFFRVTLPLSLPGVVAAFLFVFIPTLGEFVTPSLVGGASGYMYGNQIVDLFGTGFPDWETGSVLALFLLGVVAALTVVFSRFLRSGQAAVG